MGRILLSSVLPVRLFLGLFAVLSSSAQTLLPATSPTADSSRTQVKLALPMAFEANRGQARKGIDFVARGLGYTASLEAGHASICLSHPEADSSQPKCYRDKELGIKLVGARKQPQVQPEDKLAGYSNYLFGSDPSKWITNVTQYAKVRYANVYSGVDVVYYGNQDRLEHDFVVHAGADPSRIHLTFSGVQKTELSKDGDLVLHVSDSEVRMAKPRTYQLIGNRRVEIPSQYVLRERGVSFHFGRYDARRAMVIDPVLVYSTFLSGPDGGIQRATAIAVDGTKNVYVAGLTDSASFPITPGVIQPTKPQHAAFVSKINAAGTALIYSTYIGGFTRQSFDSNSVGLAVDISGNVYVAGDATGSDLPIPSGSSPFQTVNKGNNVAILKLNNAATNVLYGTYLGGSGTDFFGGIAIDTLGNAHIAGTTNSNDFPLQNALQGSLGSSGSSGFVTVLNPTGSTLVYSTYLGQNSNVVVSGIAVDTFGDTYVVGGADAGFPTTSAAYQGNCGVNFSICAFLAKLSANGPSLAYGTYFGSTTAVNIPSVAMAVDGTGIAYVANSGLLGQFNASGSLTSSTTTLGQISSVVALALDSLSNVYVMGISTASTFFPGIPLVNPIVNYSGVRGQDSGFISKLDPTLGTLLFSSYLPEAATGVREVHGLAIDSDQNIYVAGRTIAQGDANDFPVFNALQPIPADMSDAFILKISPSAGAAAAIAPSRMTFNNQEVGTTSAAQPFHVNDFGTDTLNVSNVVVDGDFAIQSNDCGTVSASGGICTIQVTFSPTTTGTRTGTLTITDSSVGSPHMASLVGHGGTATASLSPTSLAFPDQAIATTSSSQVVTLTNIGAISLLVTRVQTSGDFGETNNCGSAVAPGANCAISVSFTPTAIGNRTGNLTINDSAVDAPQTVPLSGIGSAGLGLSVSPGGSSTTVAAGQAATYTLSIGGAGISGTASLTCSGAPKGAQCSVPGSEPLNPDSPANFAVMVTTTSRTIGTLHPLGSSAWMWAMALLGWVALPWARASQKSIRRSFILLASGFLLCLQCSCGGSGGTSSGGPQPNPNGTPAGTYSLMVTATSGGMNQSTSLTLTVQ
jgi:hypothetical protein